MTENDKKQFKVTIAALAEALSPNRSLSTAAQKLYWMALNDLPWQAVEKGMMRCLRETKIKAMPTPAEIREKSGAITIESAGVVAWSTLKQAILTIGYYKSVDFEDRVINAVIRSMGGWMAICDVPKPEFDKFYYHRFLKAYKAFADSGVSAEMGHHLAGFAEDTNRLSHPDRIKPPLLIGSKSSIGIETEQPRLKHIENPNGLKGGVK